MLNIAYSSFISGASKSSSSYGAGAEPDAPGA